MDQKPRKKKILPIILLAIVCIGGAELVVCRYADPALYESIAAPTRKAAAAAWSAISDGASAAWSAVEDGAVFVKDQAESAAFQISETFREEEPLEDQASAEPDQSLAPLIIADPTITALESRENGEILTGGSSEIVYYNQADPAWCDCAYGRDALGRYGCGPAALAMAVSSLTAQSVNPEQMAQWAVENGHWARHSGSYLSIVNGAAAAYGLKAESLPNCDAERLLLELSGGKLAVALMSKGHFTNGGHFILLRGATLDGGVLVADSNSRERSLTEWDPQIILDELSKSRSGGAPLWLLSPAEE